MGQLKNRYFLATAAYCLAIFYLSSLSEPPDPGFSIPFMDKLAHALLFGGLAATLSYGIRKSNDPAKVWVQWWVPIGFAAFYGLTDEFHQTFVPLRTWELSDLAADISGAVLAQVVLVGVIWRERNPQ